MFHQDELENDGNDEVYRLTLDPESQLFNMLCNPKGSSLPSSSLTAGSGVAVYDDAYFTAPFCAGSNSKCDSSTLLEGRSVEANKPNTIDNCYDGSDATSTNYESVKRISIQSVNGNALRGGDVVEIEATIVAYSESDRVDYYYTANVDSPQWTFITSVAPKTGESTVMHPSSTFPGVAFTLPKCSSESGCKQAVRVVLRVRHFHSMTFAS